MLKIRFEFLIADVEIQRKLLIKSALSVWHQKFKHDVECRKANNQTPSCLLRNGVAISYIFSPHFAGMNSTEQMVSVQPSNSNTLVILQQKLYLEVPREMKVRKPGS